MVNLYLDVQNKIIGRVPTPANILEHGADNDLHLCLSTCDANTANKIKSIVGIYPTDFGTNRTFNMSYGNTSCLVETRLSVQKHVQLHIKIGKRESGISIIFRQFMNIRNISEKDIVNNYILLLDFKNNKIDIRHFNNVHNNAKPDTEEEKAKRDLDDVIKIVENSNLEFKNAYIEQQINARNPSIQKRYRNALLKEFNHKCAICGIDNENVLVASHAVGYAECTCNEDRINPKNGLLLCKNHDALFDKGLICFDEKTGKIILPNNETLDSALYDLLNISKDTKIDPSKLDPKRREFLKKHKEKAQKNNKY